MQGFSKKNQVLGCANFAIKSLKSRLRTLGADQFPKASSIYCAVNVRKDSLKCRFLIGLRELTKPPSFSPAHRAVVQLVAGAGPVA